MKRYEKVLNLDRQAGNRWNAAGITAREAIQLYEMWKKLDKIASKKNLWVRHERMLRETQDNIREILDNAGRLK